MSNKIDILAIVKETVRDLVKEHVSGAFAERSVMSAVVGSVTKPQKKQRCENSGKQWTKEEDEKLLSRWIAGRCGPHSKNVKLIKELGRTRMSTYWRYKHLLNKAK